MLLCEAGKVRLPLPFRDLLISLTQADNFDLGVNDSQLLLEAAAIPAIKDPYDRMIVAQARVLGEDIIQVNHRPAWKAEYRVDPLAKETLADDLGTRHPHLPPPNGSAQPRYWPR